MSVKKIAEAAGVSPSTVSRVLNNPDYKCAEPGMRERIWQIAMDMNYAPNEAARSLRSGGGRQNDRLHHIHILMTRTDASETDPFFSELLRVIESEIHSQNCILAKVWYQPLFSDDQKCRKANLEKVIGEMYTDAEEHRDGLVIIGKCNAEVIRLLRSRYRGVISVNRNSTNYEVDEVTCDGRKIAEMAVEYLLNLGHREIGYIGACYNEARFRGYTEILYEHEVDLLPQFICDTHQTEAEGYAAMEKLLKSGSWPTAIYCANDATAIGVLKCLNQFRNHPAISIIAADDIEEAQFTKPMLTTVRLPRDEMGRMALKLLLDRIQNGHRSVIRMELEGQLMVRESCQSPEA